VLLALPQAAYFLFVEAAVGSIFALWISSWHGQVSRGFLVFTGWCCVASAVLGQLLHGSFAPSAVEANATSAGLFALEQTLGWAFVILLVLTLLGLSRTPRATSVGLPVTSAVGGALLLVSALVTPTTELFGAGAAVATLSGAVALGTSLAGLSLGHWYLVAPTMAVGPLIRVNFACLIAVVAQMVLAPVLLLAPTVDPAGLEALLGEHQLFTAVRVLFGWVAPFGGAIMVWRTARIRSMDSATGILYVVATLVLVGEIAARSLFFLTGVAL
jgi:hypothetical protein